MSHWLSVRKGPKFNMEEAAGPSRPTGRNVLVQHSDPAGVGDPDSCSSGRWGRRAKRGAPGALPKTASAA
eukprot:4199733-Alexandrium_andersonii.AAC.1